MLHKPALEIFGPFGERNAVPPLPDDNGLLLQQLEQLVGGKVVLLPLPPSSRYVLAAHIDGPDQPNAELNYDITQKLGFPFYGVIVFVPRHLIGGV